MSTVLAEIVVAGVPLAAVIALLVVAGRAERAREQRFACQIAVTDAIHRELGAIVSPLVKRRRAGAWELAIAVPFDRPGLVATVLAIAQRVLSQRPEWRRRRFSFVLTPQATSRRAPSGSMARSIRVAEARRPSSSAA
jgi:hypothetical protein